MGDLPKIRTSAIQDHHSLLNTVIGDEEIAMSSRIHSYGKSINAFAANLLPDEVQRLKVMDSVVSVFPSTIMKLHTTRSWDFLGLSMTAKRNAKNESDTIVGLLDSGIYVESPSFDDKGYGPPPAKWKGSCDKGANFTGCNNKVIGARYYKLSDRHNDTTSPVDTDGHGTHTASTAAGSPIDDASFYGLAQGTARGGVPSARIAMYKVCWPNGCTSMDILAGFDDAIHDGVDILSISIGSSGASDYFGDPIAIGAFHATKKGILTLCSAGNDGPYAYSVTNIAPWIMNVGASGIDRQFRTEVGLGDGTKINGMSLNTFSLKKSFYPLITGAQASNESEGAFGSSSSCNIGTLDVNKVKGKIVYCVPDAGARGGGKDYSVKTSGGIGVVVQAFDTMDTAFSMVLPAAFVKYDDGTLIKNYINSTKDAKAVIAKTTTVNTSAPFVASFSSRGPNTISKNILKPDITAPGVDILAGWSRLASVTDYKDIDNRIVNLNIVSGTSMACPHAAAVAAYVKSFHPDWSAAAIRSAIMTTAKQMKINKNDTEFGYGSGQVNPLRALHPGLVYDLTPSSYISFLCKEGYNGTTLALIFGGRYVNCSKYPEAQGSDGLNYPSMLLQVSDLTARISGVFYRTVTNTENRKSIYKATVKSSKGLTISVVPNTLTFSRLGEKKSFKVVVKGKPLGSASVLSGSFQWVDDSKHRVRSPIVVYHANSM
ncbi:hypothetical protein ACHQM5_002911 [Ranunculus cassubicifolius]